MSDDLHWKFWKEYKDSRKAKTKKRGSRRAADGGRVNPHVRSPSTLSDSKEILAPETTVTPFRTPEVRGTTYTAYKPKPLIQRADYATKHVETIDSPIVRELAEMLTYKRPAYSASEQDFIERFVESIEGMKLDGYGNRFIRIPEVDGNRSRIMFSCHTDTVHRSSGRQQVLYDSHLKHLFKNDGLPLGADDGVGIWIMRNMIKAGVPGTYVFHQGEEIGGQGSSYIAEYEKEFLTGIDIAIAFDRRGTKDIITHQAGGRCCSDKFAAEMGRLLGNGYKACDGGIFTDTANYTGLVSECTNLSVGYFHEHTQNEFLDIEHAENLLAALLAADWTKLGAYRDPAVEDDLYSKYYKSYGVAKKVEKKESKRVSYDAIVSFVHNNPVAAADILYDYGVTKDDLDYATNFYLRNL